uniref:20 kDa protein n=1 Tax=Tomato torrado virus TaxID=370833 RepID=A0A1L5SM80_9SECO|nr:20 kDa protein [Tomato torrado virus]
MSFISRLNTSLEEEAFHKQVADSQWVCSVDTGSGIINSDPTLDFKICPKTGGAISVLSVSWRNNSPQLVPGHYLLRSGTWPITGVKLSGLLVHRSIRLETTRKLLEAQRISVSQQASSSSAAGAAGKQPQVTLTQLQEELDEAKTRLALKEKELLEALSEISKLRLQLSNQPSNDDVFSGWTEEGPK